MVVAAASLVATTAGSAQEPVPPAPPLAPPLAPSAAALANANAKAEQELQKGERDRFEAMVKADAGALNRLLGPELSYTHSNAQVQDKVGFIADIKGKVIRYLSIEPTDIHPTIIGTTAVVTGVAAIHAVQNGDDLIIKVRYTNVQINRRGEWQMVAWQATRVP